MAKVIENKMGTKPIFPLLISMAIPAMFSMMIQALYNIVDSAFVAQLSEGALTAVSIAFPIQTLMVAVSVGTSVGINSLVSRRLGEQKHEEAGQAIVQGLFLMVCSWLVFFILGLLFSNTFASMFSKNDEIISMATSYISIVTMCSVFSFMQIVTEKSLQATGNMIHPMIIQMMGAIINIILDPILIFGLFGFPRLGVTGAALATVIGQGIGMVYGLYILFTKSHAVEITLKNFKINKKSIEDIYQVGLPSMVMQSVGSVLVMGLNMILGTFSDTAVAVLGIYYKLQSFVFMPVFGLNQGLMPIMGYNYGARQKDRIYAALKYGILIALGIMSLGTLAFNFVPELLLQLFKPTEELIAIGVPALKIISWSFPLAAVSIIVSAVFQAIGRGKLSLYISLFRQLILILPIAYVLSFLGLNYVWMAFPIAECLAFIFTGFLYRSVKVNVLDMLVHDSINVTKKEG